MARTLHSFVVDLLVDELRAGLFGGLAWGSYRDRLHWARLSAGAATVYDQDLREEFGDRVTLRPTTPFSGIYVPGALGGVGSGAAWLGTYLRTVPRAKSWMALELLCAEPTGTSIRFLLGNAAGQVLRWTGAAWATTDPTVAGNWNTAAQVQTGFPSWTGTALRVLCLLSTTMASATQVFYGARAMVRLWSPSVEEDLVLRTILPRLRQVTIPVRWQTTLAAASSTISLVGLEEYRLADDVGAPALTVVSAHNLTADPTEATELLASWNPTTKLVTLTGVQPTGSTILLDLEIVPLVARATSSDFLELARLPAFVVEQLRITTEGLPDLQGRRSVRNRTALTARSVPPPERLVATFQLRVVAQYDVDLHRLLDALDSSVSSAQSTITGEVVRLRRTTSDWLVADGALTATAEWQVRGQVAYRTTDTAEALLGTMGVSAEELISAE